MPVFLTLLLFTLAPCFSSPSGVVGVVQPAPWVTVLDGGRHLHLERGRHIRFEGTGRSAFGVDRQEVRIETDALPTVLVDGAPVFGRYAVASGEVLELRGADGIRWAIRLASEAEVEASTDAVRIRDDHPRSPARLDTDEPTVFFLFIDARGGSTFTYPEA